VVCGNVPACLPACLYSTLSATKAHAIKRSFNRQHSFGAIQHRQISAQRTFWQALFLKKWFLESLLYVRLLMPGYLHD
jgi:hypothetical protein